MGDIYPNSRAIAAVSNVDTPALITINTGNGPADSLNVVVSNFSGRAADNYQVMKAFDESVYVTLFGQALTKYSMTCTTMPNQCEDSDTKLTKLSNIYKKYRIGNDDRPTITITIDGMTIKGFLVEMPIETQAQPSRAAAINFSLVILGQVILS